MKLQRLTLKNIRSYQSEEILFPNGSILLSGDVGSGKTTILLAIEYALFGLQPGQRGSSLLANGQEEGSVTLELDVDGQSIVIERMIKRGSKGISPELSAITISGVREELSVTELKTKILSILNYPEEFIKKTNLLYRYTVYAPQEEMKQIILEDADSRINLLRHIFGIDKYKIIGENIAITTLFLRDQMKSLQFEIKDIEDYRSRISAMENKITLLQTQILSKTSSLIEQKDKQESILKELKDLDDKITEKQTLDREIEKTNLLLASKLQGLAEQERELKKMEGIVQKNVTFDEKLLNAIQNQIKQTKDLIETYQKRTIDLTSQLRSLTIKKQEDLEKKERIFRLDFCPTCLQSVPGTHKHNILEETEKSLLKNDVQVSALIVESKEANAQLTDAKSLLNVLEQKRSDFEMLRAQLHEVTFAKNKIVDIQKQKQTINTDIKTLEDHAISLKEASLKLSTFSNSIKIKQDELKRVSNEQKRFEIEIAEIKKEIELDNKQIYQYEQEISKKEKLRTKLIWLTKFESWLTNEFTNLILFTERNIMIKLRDEFSKLFNKWFSMLTTDSFTVRLDETFTPVITQGDYELDYSFLSGGERTAVALAYRLALNQLINSMHSRIKTRDLIILDEPTDGFSEAQLDKVRDILQELNVAQLMIVSHEQKIESFVENILRVKKEGGYSSLNSV